MSKILNSIKALLGLDIITILACMLIVILIISIILGLRDLNQEAMTKVDMIINIISVVVLSLTASFIYMQAEANSDLIKVQYIPSIEIFLVRSKNENGSYGNRFVFLNSSSIPGTVKLNLLFRQNQISNEVKYNNEIKYRIPSEGSLITANTFFINDLPKEIEVKDDFSIIIKVSIKPDLDNIAKNIEGVYTKKYRFWKGKWDESTIGFPDILLFGSKGNFNLKTIQDETGELVRKSENIL